MPLSQNLAADADDDLDGVADPGELALIRAAPDSRAARARFAAHLLDRAPNSVIARLALARLSADPRHRAGLLAEAVRLGGGRWRAELAGQRDAPDWATDSRTVPFVAALGWYATHMADLGEHGEAIRCYRLCARLDPLDMLGALRAAGGRGIEVLPTGTSAHTCSSPPSDTVAAAPAIGKRTGL